MHDYSSVAVAFAAEQAVRSSVSRRSAANAPAFEPIVAGRYVACLAHDPAQIRAAERLRFEVFNLELGEGLVGAKRTGLDEDRFDFYMEHLLVVDRETNEIVGTYRLQTAAAAKKGFGFYAAAEFRLAPLEPVLDSAIEAGRACIRRDHRNGLVIGLLWRGISRYMKIHGARYVFGCCSISSLDPRDGVRIFRRLRRENRLHPDFYCKPHPDLRCEVDPGDLALNDDCALPSLFEGYLLLGAQVVSAPALDRAFGVIDFLTLIDTRRLSSRAARHFGF